MLPQKVLSASLRAARCFVLFYMEVSETTLLPAGFKILSFLMLPRWLRLPTQETRVQSLCWEDPLEEGMATHSSILAWGIPWTEEPGG